MMCESVTTLNYSAFYLQAFIMVTVSGDKMLVDVPLTRRASSLWKGKPSCIRHYRNIGMDIEIPL